MIENLLAAAIVFVAVTIMGLTAEWFVGLFVSAEKAKVGGFCAVVAYCLGKSDELVRVDVGAPFRAGVWLGMIAGLGLLAWTRLVRKPAHG